MSHNTSVYMYSTIYVARKFLSLIFIVKAIQIRFTVYHPLILQIT